MCVLCGNAVNKITAIAINYWINIMSLMDYLPPTLIPHSGKNGESLGHFVA